MRGHGFLNLNNCTLSIIMHAINLIPVQPTRQAHQTSTTHIDEPDSHLPHLVLTASATQPSHRNGSATKNVHPESRYLPDLSSPHTLHRAVQQRSLFPICDDGPATMDLVSGAAAWAVDGRETRFVVALYRLRRVLLAWATLLSFACSERQHHGRCHRHEEDIGENSP